MKVMVLLFITLVACSAEYPDDIYIGIDTHIEGHCNKSATKNLDGCDDYSGCYEGTCYALCNVKSCDGHCQEVALPENENTYQVCLK